MRARGGAWGLVGPDTLSDSFPLKIFFNKKQDFSCRNPLPVSGKREAAIPCHLGAPSSLYCLFGDSCSRAITATPRARPQQPPTWWGGWWREGSASAFPRTISPISSDLSIPGFCSTDPGVSQGGTPAHTPISHPTFPPLLPPLLPQGIRQEVAGIAAVAACVLGRQGQQVEGKSARSPSAPCTRAFVGVCVWGGGRLCVILL